MVRKLRIAFSVTCGIICLLLIGLWVRSYWYDDLVRAPFSKSNALRLRSEVGWLTFGLARATPSTSRWSLVSQNIEKRHKDELDFIAAGGTVTRSPYSFGLLQRQRAHYFVVPHWSVLIMIATLAALPWVRCRFSLRTLLIAMTLIAAALGAVVWAVL